MYHRFLTFIKKERLFGSHEHLLLGVSGGVDSMVMAHLVRLMGVPFGVAHVNYKLRGQDSDEDAQLVKTWCRDNDVSFHLREVDPSVYQVGASTQMVARNVRYDFYNELVRTQRYTKIVTAHNANDNVETVLFNLTKGTGVAGMVGIAPKKENVVRPLLFATKEEIYAFATSENIAWREDRTNSKSNYSRNLIRNEVIPLLRQINPSLETTFQESLLRFRGAFELLDNQKQQVVNDYLKHHETSDELTIEWVQNNHQSLLLLTEIIKDYGFHFPDAKAIHTAILSGQSGAFFYADVYQINLDRSSIFISEKGVEQQVDVVFGSERKEVMTPLGQLTFSESDATPSNFSDSNSAFLDADKVAYPLRVRSWQEGDHFIPYGMNGKKKISDFMIDLKIPVTLKRRVLVLESEGEIVWVIGFRIADPYKITSKTQKVLKIQMKDA